MYLRPSQLAFGCGAAKYWMGSQTVEHPCHVRFHADWRSQIDFVILWSGPQSSWAKGAAIARERNNEEIVYLLRSIALHAPWVHKIWILVDKQVDSRALNVPQSLRDRIEVTDRCSFMLSGTCPTRNSFAVETFAQRLPSLSERWILLYDDIFLGRSVEPSHFFNDEGKPFVWRKKATWGFGTKIQSISDLFWGVKFHRIYEDPFVFSYNTPKSSSPSPHFWYPQLKSVCASMEAQYPEFYDFVASHKEGRYGSLSKGVSDVLNSQEEDFKGWMN